MSAPADEDLDALREALEDPDPATRARAARTLGLAGTAAGGAVDALRRTLADADPIVRSMAAAALGKVGAAAGTAVPDLVRALDDAVAPVRFWAADALGRLGQDAPGLRDALKRVAADDDPAAHAACRAARQALARLGHGAPPAGGAGEGLG